MQVLVALLLEPKGWPGHGSLWQLAPAQCLAGRQPSPWRLQVLQAGTAQAAWSWRSLQKLQVLAALLLLPAGWPDHGALRQQLAAARLQKAAQLALLQQLAMVRLQVRPRRPRKL